MISISIDRASLSLAPLVITNDPFAGTFHLPEDGVALPGWSMRRTYAPDSFWVGGKQLLAAVREAATLPLVIYAHASTTVALEAAKAELEVALSQFDYDITLTVDSVATTYRCEPEWPQWGPVDSGMVRAHMARAAVVVPVNP